MRIFVCIKQVPDKGAKIKLNSNNDSIDDTSIKWMINPSDEFAIEEALNLKSAVADSTVTVVTLGPKKRAVDSLRTALAMGADDVILVDCEADVDSATTAQALSKVIKDEGDFGIVFAGTSAIDKNASVCGQQIAELLEIPHATCVTKFEYKDGDIHVSRSVENGATEMLELKGPALIGTARGLNSPRTATLPGLMKAKKKPVKEINFSELALEGVPKVTYSQYEMPPEKAPVKMIDGDVAQQVKELTTLLKDEAKVL